MIEYARLSRLEQIRLMRRLATRALDRFGVEPASLSLLQHFDNTTFHVTSQAGERFNLHIQQAARNCEAQARLLARAESEVWWLDRLRADLDLSVPSVVHAPDGEGALLIGVEGVPEERLCTLFRWMDGRFIRRRLTPSHLAQVGGLTARLHNYSEGLTVPPGFDRPRADVVIGVPDEEAMRRVAGWAPAATVQALREALHRVRRTQEDLGEGRDVFGLIHADIHQFNYLFDHGEVRLIDFGDSGWGHYLYDLAVTQLLVADFPRAADLWRAHLAGYRQVRALSAEHERLIGDFSLLRQVQDLTAFLGEAENPGFAAWAAQNDARLAMLEEQLAAR